MNLSNAWRLRGVLVLLLSLSFAVSARADDDRPDFSDLFVFGDSLSDAGNLAAFTEPPFDFSFLNVFPYDAGFSNGPRAAEVLADRLGLEAAPSNHLLVPFPIGTNFAFSGARAVTSALPVPIDLPTQVAAFLGSQGGVAPPDALYLLFVGGNDIRDARDAPDRPTARQIVDAAARSAKTALRALVAAGARYVLVVNSGDIGSIPETRALAAADPGIVRDATRLTRRYNRKLARAVRAVEREFRLDVAEVDTFSILRIVREAGPVLGFDNVDDACFFTSLGAFNPECENGANFDSFVYFDEIHPTGRVHAILGKAMFATVWKRFETDDDDEDDDEDDDDDDEVDDD